MLDFTLEVLPIILFTVSYGTFVWIAQNSQLTQRYFWPITIIFFILIKSRDFYTGYLNEDELQWLVSANSLKKDTYIYFSYFLAGEISRFFTILPLAIIGILNDHIGITQARIVNVSLYVCFFYFQYKIFFEIYKEKSTQLLATSILVCAIGLGTNPDLVSYNSEIVVITLLSFSFYCYLKAKRYGNWSFYLISGFFAALVPLAKEQALPIAITLLLFYFIQQIRLKNYSNIFFLCFGGVLLIISFIGYILVSNTSALLNILWSSSQVYLSHGLAGIQSTFLLKSLSFIQSNYFEATNGVLGLLASLGVAISIWKKDFQFLNSSNYNFLFLILFGVTLFVIINPGNSFYHYTILNYFSISYFLAYFLIHSKKISKSISFLLIIFILSISIIKNKRFFPVYAFQLPIKHDSVTDQVLSTIKKHVKANEHMLVWGWDSKYYLESKMLRTSLFLTPVFTDKQYPKHNEVLNIFVRDIRKMQPKIIVEAVGKGRFYFSNALKWRMDLMSVDLKTILHRKYILIGEGYNYRIFLKKS